MAKLTIATGKKTYEIADEYDNVRGTISFNPKDTGFFIRIAEFKEHIVQLVDEIDVALSTISDEEELLLKLNDYDKLIKSELNKVFDDESTSDVVFGNQCTYTTINGKSMIENFLEVFLPIIQEEYAKEQEMSQKRVENYLKQVN